MSNKDHEYFRKDQDTGVTGPDLSKTDFTYAEHVVRARGKRTRYTSVSLDPERIRMFGPCTYVLQRDILDSDGHMLIEHDRLLSELRRTATNSEKAERSRALQAIRYVVKRMEGLVDWRFDTSGVERKNLITWATEHVQRYFSRV